MRILLPIFTLFWAISACAGGRTYPELRTVNYVDLNEYQGLWYEVYRFPNRFEKNCANVTAQYTPNKNGTISVVNSCLKQKNGKLKKTKATAFVVNKDTNATLKVSFVPFFQRWGWFGGDYNVLALGDNYEWAVVGTTDRKFLWFLSRSPDLSEDVVKIMKEEAQSQEFDLSKLIKTPRQ